MGCGSSKASVAVLPREKVNSIAVKEAVQPNKNNDENNNENNNNKETTINNSHSVGAINRNGSSASLSSRKSRDKKNNSAKSRDSRDSGLDSRCISAESQQSHHAPPADKDTSHARHKLLRISSLTNSENSVDAVGAVSDTNRPDSGHDAQTEDAPPGLPRMDVIERPKTRHGNVAFELMMPDVGNQKRKLPALSLSERKTKKGTKRVKTREDIERKMRVVEERRKEHEVERQQKAIQTRHAGTRNTVVEKFSAQEDTPTPRLDSPPLES